MKKLFLFAFAVAVVAVATPASVQAQNCWVREGATPLGERPSPLDSAVVDMGGDQVKVCYGAPSAKGRTFIGGEGEGHSYPYGEKNWRMGANEATAIHLPFAASVAGVDVDAGSYSLYALPDRDSWRVFVNSVAERWGANMGPGVAENDIGSGEVSVSAHDHTETLNLSFEDAGSDAATLVLRWEGYQVDIPIRRR